MLTSVEIDPEMYREIKERGMTIKGAFREGWKAIKERQENNERIRQLEENIKKYQKRLIEVL